ncbi:hypothetical protein F3Y22_tig00003721pilonHSYRG00346 [Hibiscus syriacus]|uniref:PUM-HD domain-containing protein n=1 Tax=Hibiscus syriacus TaxID=106335 RepID=A0A6A3CJP3_HIBSY|nr:hypothetical protein F3Y22_tig00003721pilonHSYRG00346 [Hibiscus syriacus]
MKQKSLSKSWIFHTNDGNYLVQKLLDLCTEEQRLQIVLTVTKEPGQLVRISLNTYGQQISHVESALRPGILDLVKDLNGNHVLQRCLQCLDKEDNKIIFDAAAKFCVDIAMDAVCGNAALLIPMDNIEKS